MGQKYYVVLADALPEVFVKVAEAKRMLQLGEVRTIGEAASAVASYYPRRNTTYDTIS